MNWRFTRPGRVRFEAGEPFCHLFPLQRQLIEQVQPQWKPLSETPQLAQQHADWTHSRTRFLDALPDARSAAAREKWQRGYFLGVPAPGQPPTHGHRSRLRLPMFTRADSDSPAE